MSRNIVCPDCQGHAKLIGDADSWEIICYECDYSGPVLKYNSEGDKEAK